MDDRELQRESKRAFRAVMRELNSSVRFDTPDEWAVLRANFQTARTRSLLGLVGGGAACGVGWRYAIGRRFSPLVAAWGAFTGMTVGMLSVRQKMFLDLLSIPEERSPFARRAREILEQEMPATPLLSEIRRRRRELYPSAQHSTDEVIWTEPPSPPFDNFITLEETLRQVERDRTQFPGAPATTHSSHHDARSAKQGSRQVHEAGDWTHKVNEIDNDIDGHGKESTTSEPHTTWEELRRRASRR